MTENRFKNLIDPIRDIAENWNIDIAESLDNYLEELESLKISYEGNNELNFAEAALLIQGSTNSTEIVNDKNKSKGKNSNNSSILDDERLIFGSDPSFLLLDDILEESDNIDMKVDNDENNQSNNKGVNQSKTNLSLSKDFSKNSMMLMHSILQDDYGNNSLKMSSCRVDVSGALILNGINSIDTNNIMDTSFNKNSILNKSIHSDGYNMDVPFDDHEEYFSNDKQTNPNDNLVSNDLNDIINVNNDIGNSHEAEIDKNFIRSNFNEPFKQNAVHNNLTFPFKSASLDPHEMRNDSKPYKKGITYVIPKSLKSNISCKRQVDIDEQISQLLLTRYNDVPLINPDIDDDTVLTTDLINPIYKKFIKSNIIPVRTRISRKKVDDNNDIVEVHTNSEFNQPSNKNAIINANINFDYDNEDDQYMYRDAYDDIVKTPYINTDTDYCNNVINNKNINQPIENIPIEEQLYWDDIDDNDYGVSNLQSEINEEEELSKRVRKILDEEYNDINHNSFYEKLCRQHIDSFMHGAEKYARETQLSKRVTDWTNKLDPILREQEKIPAYDIHQYSDNLLVKVNHITKIKSNNIENISNDNCQIKFEEIAQGQNNAEVCRIFLACLQLVNMGNLQVCSSDIKGNNDLKSKGNMTYPVLKNVENAEYNQTFSLKLLNITTRKLEFETFLAPSLVDK
eukprot:gene17504-23061_t